MRKPLRPAWLSPLMIALVLPATGAFAETFRVATYNVENYLDQPTETRHYAKSEAAKAQVRANPACFSTVRSMPGAQLPDPGRKAVRGAGPFQYAISAGCSGSRMS